ncbi:hypothetical protein BaRGS_00023155, partial [Batillaria attramentaria]
TKKTFFLASPYLGWNNKDNCSQAFTVQLSSLREPFEINCVMGDITFRCDVVVLSSFSTRKLTMGKECVVSGTMT